MKKLYLVQRTDKLGYDEHFGFVICADSKAQVLILLEFFQTGTSATFPSDPNKFILTYLGIASTKLPTSIILDSFNAG